MLIINKYYTFLNRWLGLFGLKSLKVDLYVFLRHNYSMKKILSCTLILILSIGHLAFASSIKSCGEIQSSSSGKWASTETRSCCTPKACSCHIKVDVRLFDQLANSALFKFSFSSVSLLPALKILNRVDLLIYQKFSEKSPPQYTPLYSLYSVYRI